AYPELRFAPREAPLPEGVAAAFLCLPHGEAAGRAGELLEAGVQVVDLSGDHRLRDPALYPRWYGWDHAHPERLAQAVYGLTEWAGEELSRETRLVANPGCYPTAALLALLPALAARLVRPEGLVVDALSGVSGAGVRPSGTTHFVHANESVKAYKVGRHQHTPEIEQACGRVAGVAVTLAFTPHLVPMNRGILVTAHGRLARDLSTEAAREVYAERYREAPFVHLLPEGTMPDTARVRGSNQCHLQVVVDRRSERLVMLAAIDNLVKGAAGQAVQNLNRIRGWPETAALLHLLPVTP
ncbi:MAG: N-acetyl-gamma-glutamyl-phosphate reductase, partial [Nitrospirae bacterium]